MVTRERKANRLKTGDLVGEYLNTYLNEVRQAPQDGKQVAYVSGQGIWFMLSAQDIVFVHGEGYGAFSSARKWQKPLQEVTASEGISPEVCSYSRTHFGCAFLAKTGAPPDYPAMESLLPKPQLAATVYQNCSTQLAWVNAIRQLHNVPTFVVEVPYIRDPKEEPAHHRTMVSRLEEFVEFIEMVSGCPYNWDRLKELLAVIKQASALRGECLALGCRHRPAPGTFFDWAISMGPVNYLAGRPETIGFYEQFKAEIEERIARDISAVPDEKYRILWEGIMFWPKVGALSERFAAANCAVIGGSYTQLSFWPFAEQIAPERPLDTIATYLLGSGIYQRRPRIYQDYIVQMCKDYSIDGVMLCVPHTCRPIAARLQMLGSRLMRDLGIPVVEFEGDQSDADFYSDLRTNYAVDALLEAVAAVKRR